MPRKTAQDAIRLLIDLFNQLQRPKCLVDRVAVFSGCQYKSFCQDSRIELHIFATGMPRRNGQVERVMRTLFNMLRQR